MPSRDNLSEFTAWCGKNITGDETFPSGNTAQLFLDRLFQAFGQPGCLDVGGVKEFRVADLQKECPGVSLDMIRHLLDRLRKAKQVKCLDIGRNARWQTVAN